MKSKLLIGALFFAMMSTAASVWADGGSKTFSNKDVKGTYAEQFSGFVVGPGKPPSQTGTSFPETGTGTLTTDGNGGFQAKLTFTIGGLLCSGTVAGGPSISGGDGFATGYTVNPDGTGTARGIFTPNPAPSTLPPQIIYGCPASGGHQDESFTIVSPRKIDFISTDSDSVISGTAERQTHDNGD